MKQRVSFVILATAGIAAATLSLAALLGVNLTHPLVAYTTLTTTAVNYNAITQLFSVDAPPTTVTFSASEAPKLVTGVKSLRIRAMVDNLGNLVTGVAGPDLILSGTVTRVVGTVTNTYTGLLLTGEVTGFGYQDVGATDLYDFRFTPTGGALLSFYTCGQIGVQVTSEASTFTGSFLVNFNGRAKGNVGLEDLTPPTITCPFGDTGNSTNVKCNAQGSGQPGAFVTFPAPIATDNCDTNVMITCAPTNGSFFALAPGDMTTNHTVTCTGVDDSGNQSSCSFVVTVEDTMAPDFDPNSSTIIEPCDDLDHPQTLTNDTGHCYATFTFMKPLASDCCSGSNVTVTVSAIDENGFIIPLTEFPTNVVWNGQESEQTYVTGQFPLTCVRSNVVTSTATDGAGNSSQHKCAIFVFDLEPPTIICPSNQTVECTGGPVFFEEATASDNCPGVTNSCVPPSGSVLDIGTHEIVCTAMDNCGGNTAQCTFNVIVQDTTPPTISCPTDVTVECGQPTGPSATGTATASDTCDSSPTVTFTDATSGTCPTVIDRTWNAVDDAGNTNQCTQVITVQDTTAPTISCPADKQLQCGGSTAPSNTGTATGSDTCSGPVTITYVDAATPTNCTGKAGIDRTWKATDGCNNSSTCVQHITFVDTTPPTVTVPTGSNLGCNPTNLPTDVSVKALVTATDNCSTTSVTVTHVDTNIACTVTRTFTVIAKDACNNSTTKTVVYTHGCPPCVPFTFNFQGNTALSGAVANVRTFIANGVSVKVTAFSRKTTGAWATAYLGSYTGGLGVTDSSEGSGSSNRHTVDNIDRNNYVLLEFSQPVVLNRAYLGYVVTDSDLKLWIGTFTDPFNNHLTLSDAVLGSFGYTETSLAYNNSTRWADVNAGEVTGNAIVIAADPGDTTPDDQFKIALFDVCKRQCTPLTLACAASTGQVGVAYSSTLVRSGGTAPYTFTINSGSLPPGLTLNPSTGAITGTPTTAGTYTYVAKVTDSLGATALTSGCTITIAAPCIGSICGSVLRDCDANGNLSGESGLSGVTVKLKNSSGTVLKTTNTSSSGGYCFTGLAAGTYTVVVTQPTNYALTAPAGCNNQQTITLSACQNKSGVNFGYRGTAPSISLKKTAVKTSSTTITYTFTVKNTGNTCFYGGMHVNDPKLGGQIFYQSPVSPGQSFTFTKTYTIKSSDPTYITNTATATGHPPTGSAVSVTATATIHK